MYTAEIKTEQFGRIGVRFRLRQDSEPSAPEKAQSIAALLNGQLVEVRQSRVLNKEPGA